MELATMEILGTWLSIFLTISVLSFLYDDNPIYKFAEHLFMGVSIGYGVSESLWSMLKPNMLDKLAEGNLIYAIPLVLCILLMFKVTRNHAWLARIPIAMLVAAYAAVKVTGEASGKLLLQLRDSIPDMTTLWNEHGFWDSAADGAGVFSATFLVLGLSASLIHFYFSEIPTKIQKVGTPLSMVLFVSVLGLGTGFLPIEDITGRLIVGTCMGLCAAAPALALSPYKKHLTRFGVLVLMISFGASFGFTVMGRISLAIGRAQHMMGLDRPAQETAQIHPQIASLLSIAIVLGVLIVLRKRGHQEE